MATATEQPEVTPEIIDAGSLPRFPWCIECGELMIFGGSGGSCPRGHGKIYPAAGKAAWRAVARRAWIAGLPVANYVGKGLYVVVGRPELNGLKLVRAKEKDEWQPLKPVKPADFEQSREGRFVVVKSTKRKNSEGHPSVVMVPIVLAVIEEQGAERQEVERQEAERQEEEANG